jgi:hypothetical protein
MALYYRCGCKLSKILTVMTLHGPTDHTTLNLVNKHTATGAELKRKTYEDLSNIILYYFHGTELLFTYD